MDFTHELEGDGLRIRVVPHCDDADCAAAYAVAGEGDRWFCGAVLMPMMPGLDPEEAVQESLLDDERWCDGQRRLVALLGTRWGQLDGKVLKEQVALVGRFEPWLIDEIQVHEPEFLRGVADWVTDDVCEALKIIRYYRRNVDRRISGTVRGR